jgi:glycosyltransferase involved in cell wall biosynthesis
VGPSLDILGGQAIQADRLLRHLRELPGIDASFLPVNPRLPGPLRRLQSIKYVRTVVTSLRYLASLLSTLPRCDVVHAFSASYWSFLLAPLPAMAIGRLLGKRVVLNYRSGEADDHLARWRLSARAMRLAHAIVVPSGYLVDVFSRYGLHAVPVFNFVDPERIPYRARGRPRPVFLSNRNFEALYNVACVLRAFARIQRSIPDAELIIAGDGTHRRELERLAADLGLRGVRFVGRKAPAEMAQLYDAADVYLNAPNIDNMPNSVLEAFAAGIPVVSTDAGGIGYIVEHERNGLLVSRDDDAALATAAIRVVQEPGLAARLTTEARRDCLALYTWEAVGTAWARVYRDVLSGRPTHSSTPSPA